MSAVGQEGVTIGEGECLRETERAILVKMQEDDKELWIPKSVLHDDSEVFEKDTEGAVVVFRWWAEKEGLDD